MNELQKRFNDLPQEKRKRIQKILEAYKDSPCYKTPHEKQIESEVTQLRAENEKLKAELAEVKKDAGLWREREAKIKSLKERGFLGSPLRSEP